MPEETKSRRVNIDILVEFSEIIGLLILTRIEKELSELPGVKVDLLPKNQ